MSEQPLHRRFSRTITTLVSIVVLAAPLRADKNQADINDPFEPTPPQAVDDMLRLAGVTASDYVFDLGCGDGRIVIAAAKNFGAKAFGVDLDPQRIEECKEGAEAAAVTDKVTFQLGSYFDVDLRPATVLATYLLAETNLQLRPKYFRELRPGTRLVSHCFDMADWKADRTEHSPKAREQRILYWVIPAPVGGPWRWSEKTESGQMQFRLELQQGFQTVTGDLTAGKAARRAIRNATINGKDLQFQALVTDGKKVVNVAYKGAVDGDTIRGTQTWEGGVNGDEREWVARREPLDIAGTWRVTVANSPEPLDGVVRIARKDAALQAVYVRDNPTTETLLATWIAWGNSIYFEIPLASDKDDNRGEEGRGPIFSGTLGTQDGRGKVTHNGWPSSPVWTAKREK
jgi:SAM-dependent methyltransferase